MILLFSLLVAVAAVAVRRRRLDTPKLRGVSLVAFALAAQILVINVLPSTIPHGLASAVHLASYALGGAFLFLNFRVRGFALLAAGGLGNLAAIAANGGVMPARPEALALAGIVQDAGTYANSAAVSGARLWWLGDVFAVPQDLPLANVFSIGDILLVVGAYVVLDAASRRSASVEVAVPVDDIVPDDALAEARGGLRGLVGSHRLGDLVIEVQARTVRLSPHDRVVLSVFLRAIDKDPAVANEEVRTSTVGGRLCVSLPGGHQIAHFAVAA